MAYTKQDLIGIFFGIGAEEGENELDECLNSCQIPRDREDYSEREKTIVQKYRQLAVHEEAKKQYFDDGIDTRLFEGEEALLDYVELTLDQLLKKFHLSGLEGTRSEKNTREEHSSSLSDLLTAAKEKISKPMSLSQMGEMLRLANLTEKDRYEQEESERFLMVVDKIFNQGLSIGSVASEMGISRSSSGDIYDVIKAVGAESSGDLFASIKEITAIRQEKLLEIEDRIFFSEVAKGLSSDGSARKQMKEERKKVVDKILNSYVIEAIDVTEIYGTQEPLRIAPGEENNAK